MAVESSSSDTVIRRNRPGTKAEDMFGWPEQDFNDMETVLAGTCMVVERTVKQFKLQRYLYMYRPVRRTPNSEG